MKGCRARLIAVAENPAHPDWMAAMLALMTLRNAAREARMRGAK